MEFKQLESFVAVVKYQSFTKAASHLYISQPTISSHIRSLEEELHSRLIIRTTKSFSVTPRGMEFYECAVHILETRDQLLQSWDPDTQKVISLGVSTIPSAYILPEVLPAFGKLHPDIYFRVEQENSQKIIDSLSHDKYDIGLVGSPCHEETIACVPFYEDTMILITPVNDHYLSLRNTKENILDTLLKEPMILREKGSGSQKQADRFFEKMNINPEHLHVVAKVNDQESIKNLVAGGLGVSFISQKAAQNFINEKRILAFELPQDIAGRNLYILYRKNYMLHSYIDKFISFLRTFYID